MIGRTARLVLELLAHEHAEGLHAALAPAEVARYLTSPDVTTVAALHDRIDHLLQGPADPDERWLNVVMRRAADGAIIGRLEASVHRAGHTGGWAELAYLVGPAYQHHGYAREGVQWLIDHLAAEGITELWVAIHAANARSIALVEALGWEPAPVPPQRPLGSYDPGDVVYARRARS
ncbi:MAG TPA: GNAT family N-acetyltransferase [Kofleriaceae bacterium]|nr:GNAT family N-acetyltransferase [Kofleriaceae bacterium]